jgi:hypothetical protein
MRLVAILGAQTVLIFALDLYFDSHLCLWLLYFLPLLGTARHPSLRLTVVAALLLPILLVGVGLCKLGQFPWEEIFIPRALAIYALGLTAVLLIRGKQFGTRAMDAVAEAGQQMHESDTTERLRRDVELARQKIRGLSDQLREAYQTNNQSGAEGTQVEIERLLRSLHERLS